MMNSLNKLIYKLPENITLIQQNNDLLLCYEDKSIKVNFLKKIKFEMVNNSIKYNSEKNNNINKLLNRKVKGLLHGFKIELQLIGIGYKGQYQDNILTLRIGFSHEVKIVIPAEIEIFLENEKTIICYSQDYELLTNFCAKLINKRRINVFTGQGIKKKNEQIILRKNKKK